MVLKFRKIKEDDLEMIMKWRMSPEVTKYMYSDPILDLNKQREWYENIIKKEESDIYWIINFENTDIGVISINNIDKKNKHASRGHYIGDLNFRGRGLSRSIQYNTYYYAFEKLHLNKLWFEILEFNHRNIELSKKYGAKIEGIFKEHCYKNGTFYDVVRMAMLKKEWDQIKNNIEYEKAEIE